MKKDKELRKKMAEMFEDLEAMPQTETWENIQAAISEPKQKKAGFWLVASFLAFLMCGIGGYLMLTFQHNADAKQETASKLPKPFEKGEGEAIRKETKETIFDFKGSEKLKPNLVQVQKEIQSAFLPLNIRFDEAEKRFNRFSQSSQNNLDIIKKATTININLQISDSNTHKQATFDIWEKIRNKQTQKDSAIYALESRKIKFTDMIHYQPFIPKDSFILPKSHSLRKNYFSTNLSIFSDFQLMQEQKNALYSMANPQLLPTFDAKRLGISVNLAYNHAFTPKNEIAFGINAAALPQNFTYQMENNHIYKVKFTQNGQYSIQKQSFLYQKREYLLFVGAEIMYRYHFLSEKNSPISGILGALANVEMRHKQLNYWFKAGLDIRLTSQVQLSPILQYQLNRSLDENALMKTRLYAFGLGATYQFR